MPRGDTKSGKNGRRRRKPNSSVKRLLTPNEDIETAYIEKQKGGPYKAIGEDIPKGSRTKTRNSGRISRSRLNCLLVCLLGTIFVLGALLAIGLAIAALVISSNTRDDYEQFEKEASDNCFSVMTVPGGDLQSSIKGHVCFECNNQDGKDSFITAVLNYNVADPLELISLVNSALTLSGVANEFQEIEVCFNQTGTPGMPACPAFSDSCVGSCKTTGKLTLKEDDNERILPYEQCVALKNNPGIYWLFISITGVETAAVGQLNVFK